MASTFQPYSVQGVEGSMQLSPVYAYAIRSEDLSDGIFLTGWQKPISISGLPARFAAANPQQFLPTQIGHDTIERRADFDRHGFQVTARFDTANLPAFFVTTPTTPMTVEIIRIAKGTVGTSGSEIAAWGTDTYVVQSGLIEDITLRGDLVTVGCVPKAFHMESGVPRLWFNRTCQWALYGPGCNVVKASFDWESQIEALNRRTREVRITGIPAGTAADHFTGGYFSHNDTGAIFTALSATTNAGDTVLTIGHWSEELEVGDQVVLFPGCARTATVCASKFSNAANFGGFDKLPDRNPSIHGV
jgi:hypothetical protein